jgi:hypothetical protein
VLRTESGHTCLLSEALVDEHGAWKLLKAIELLHVRRDMYGAHSLRKGVPGASPAWGQEIHED